MPLKSRLIILAVLVVVYYGQFFVPLLSVEQISEGDAISIGLDWLSGFSVHEYHYLSIGIIPFIFSSIAIGVAKWQLPSLYQQLSSLEGGVESVGRILTYSFAVLIVMFKIGSIPVEAIKYHISLVFVEMMFSVWCIEQILNHLKPLKLLSSPLMLFLGLNILGSIIFDIYSLNYSTFSQRDWVWFSVSLVICAFSVLFALFIMKWKEDVRFISSTNSVGKVVVQSMSIKAMRAGITPVIYVMFILLPIAFLVDKTKDPLTHFFNPLFLLAFFLTAWLVNYKLLLVALPMKEVTGFSSSKGIFHIKNNDVYDFSNELQAINLRQSRQMALSFSLFLLISGFWIEFSPSALSSLSYVGGVGIIILINTIKDFGENTSKIKEELLYGQ